MGKWPPDCPGSGHWSKSKNRDKVIEKFRIANTGKSRPWKGKKRPKISKALMGRVFTEEWKNNLSKAHMGQIAWNKGKKLSPEHIEKLRISHLGYKHSGSAKRKLSESISGGKHWNWQGGISREPYPVDWTKILKRSIRERDNHKCQLCGCPQEECIQKLCVHHIDYNKKNLNPTNLISLCRKCHNKTHHNRDKWTKLFQRRESSND